MTTYNCKHSGDQYQITKFNRHGEVESSYLCDHVSCQCPAGVRDTCRHRLMLPTFLSEGLVNSNLFLDWDNGKRIVDFNGLPATAPTRIVDEDDIEIIHPGSFVHTRDGYIEHEGGVDARDVTPATVQSNEASTIDLAPQALTDTEAQALALTAKLKHQPVTILENSHAYISGSNVRPYEDTGPAPTQPANPNGWRRF